MSMPNQFSRQTRFFSLSFFHSFPFLSIYLRKPVPFMCPAWFRFVSFLPFPSLPILSSPLPSLSYPPLSLPYPILPSPFPILSSPPFPFPFPSLPFPSRSFPSFFRLLSFPFLSSPFHLSRCVGLTWSVSCCVALRCTVLYCVVFQDVTFHWLALYYVVKCSVMASVLLRNAA